MVDRADLRKLAEAVQQGDNPAALNSRMAFIAAASPDVFLGLLDEIGRLDRALKGQFAMNGELIRITNKHSALSQNAENDKEGLRECSSILTEENETLRAERDQLRAVAVRLKEALSASLEKLGLLHQFMCDAHKCDFNEDRTNSWIAYMDHDVRKFSHGEAAEALADPEVEKL